jgi:adenylate cyclase
MSFEIERKFLVRNNDWQQHAAKHCDIRQAYLTIGGKASVRVRILGNHSATLTAKSRPAELRRLELEYPIPMLEAEALMPLRQGSIVEKARYRIPCGELAWEIDVFSGENEGLVIAEIELRDEQQHVELPSWIGEEVTGKPEYYNSFLVQNPFRSWSEREAGRFRRLSGRRGSACWSTSSARPGWSTARRRRPSPQRLRKSTFEGCLPGN